MKTDSSCTLITKASKAEPMRGRVLYDRDCALCAAWAKRLEVVLRRRGFALAPLQAPWVQNRLGLTPEQALTEMKLLLADGRVYGGADAIIEMSRETWWGTPVVILAKLPVGLRLMRAGYRLIASRRSCRLQGAPASLSACSTSTFSPSKSAEGTRVMNLLDWAPLLVLVSDALAIRQELPAWAFMWLMAWAIFFGCKFLTWQRAWRDGLRTSSGRSLGYLFAWPGMDAMGFLKAHSTLNTAISSDLAHRPPRLPAEWLIATARTLIGVFLVWIAARGAQEAEPLVRGWIGMVGIVMCLHFGFFHILALAWRKAGVNVMPVMDRPLCSTSLADFWGRRWNSAFNTLARDLIFRPLKHRMRASSAIFAVFLVSGLIHEGVISLPAGGGYGLPTAYFGLQAAGIAIERSKWGRGLGLGHGPRGWCYALGFAALPAIALFHLPFVRNVIVPMLDAIGPK